MPPFTKEEIRLLTASQLEACQTFENILNKFQEQCWRVYFETPKWHWLRRRRLYNRWVVFFKMMACAMEYGSTQEVPD